MGPIHLGAVFRCHGNMNDNLSLSPGSQRRAFTGERRCPGCYLRDEKPYGKLGEFEGRVRDPCLGVGVGTPKFIARVCVY